MAEDTRKDQRVKAQILRARYKSTNVDEFIDQYSKDISRSGMFIKTPRPPALGALLKIEIQLKDGSPVLGAVGRVVQRRGEVDAKPDAPAGMGICFLKVEDASLPVIDQIMARKGEGAGPHFESSRAPSMIVPMSAPPSSGMSVTRLKLANVRGVEDAEFTFKSGFNLIVGVNGVGKTTVLDALRVCFSRIFPGITPSKAKAMSFERSDIRQGCPFLNAVLHLEIDGREFTFERREWRDAVVADNEGNIATLRREIIESERLRERPRKLLRELTTPQALVDSDFYSPNKPELQSAIAGGRYPLAVFYSTSRSMISAAASKAKSAGHLAAGYAEALVPRPWHIQDFADWIRVQESLASERDEAARHVAVMKSAASRFLPECTDIKPGETAGSSLTITKAGFSFDVRQLSDGERGALGIALDLARRLSQVNPKANDPLAEGEAIVLIDEIDLHLHPKWQRQIVHNLTAAFPRCQFIATTHSPQVIGEVESDRIQVMGHGDVFFPTHSFGIDSSRVLEEIMDASPRSSEVQALLDHLSKRLADKNFNEARTLIADLAKKLGEADAEVIRSRTMLDFLGGDE